MHISSPRTKLIAYANYRFLHSVDTFNDIWRPPQSFAAIPDQNNPPRSWQQLNCTQHSRRGVKEVRYPCRRIRFCGLLLAAIVNKICTSFHVSRPTVWLLACCVGYLHAIKPQGARSLPVTHPDPPGSIVSHPRRRWPLSVLAFYGVHFSWQISNGSRGTLYSIPGRAACAMPPDHYCIFYGIFLTHF